MTTRDYDFERLLHDLRRIRTMGSLPYWIGKIPGLGGVGRQLEAESDVSWPFRSVEAMICSMTPEERRNPALIDGYRRERIAGGSGTTHWEVAQLVRGFQRR